MAATEIARVLGGEKVLGREIRTDVQLEECAREGFPVGVLQELIERAVILPGELYRWIIPRRTLAHRQKNQQRLSLEESNRVSRLARIYAMALETLGEDEKAKRWLRRPLRQFRGRTPMEMLETDLGAYQVEVLLGRIGHGLAA
jgi:putative toxin-antitoxin system antitoxin component (TIGR02293 family)